MSRGQVEAKESTLLKSRHEKGMDGLSGEGNTVARGSSSNIHPHFARGIELQLNSSISSFRDKRISGKAAARWLVSSTSTFFHSGDSSFSG